MIILHFDLQPLFTYELFHIYFTAVLVLALLKANHKEAKRRAIQANRRAF